MTEDFDVVIERIRSKLTKLKEQRIDSFGAERHRFQLNPPIAEEALLAFEQRHRIRLPDDYRSFLLKLGNGGAGPYYGILPLEAWDMSVLYEADAMPADYLARPFPFTPEWHDDPQWRNRLQALNLEPIEEDDFYDLHQGAITLAEQGCGQVAMLVVSGPCRGQVIYSAICSQNLPFFVENLSFLTWYERWLDELVRFKSTVWFGYGMPGEEADFLAVIQDATSTRRADAMGGLVRLKQVSQASLALARTCLNDSDPAVKARAINLLAQHVNPDLLVTCKQLVSDPSAEVRRAAFYALTKAAPHDWVDAGRRLLMDPDPSVVDAALFHLKKENYLRPEDLVPLASNQDEKRLGDLAYALADLDAPLSRRLLLELAEHSDATVRLKARYALVQIPHAETIPRLEALLARGPDPEDSTGLVSAIHAITEKLARRQAARPWERLKRLFWQRSAD